jgi:protein disulfide-isomerase
MMSVYSTQLHNPDFGEHGELYAHKGRVVVLFYMPGCGWCKKLMPQFNEFARIAVGQKADPFLGSITTAMVDASAEYKLMSRIGGDGQRLWPYRVNGYPMIVGYFDGVPYSIYNGDRTPEDLLEYAKNIGTKYQRA